MIKLQPRTLMMMGWRRLDTRNGNGVVMAMEK